MKQLPILLLLFYLAKDLNAQSVAINNNGSSPDASAILDIQSTSKGILVPKMTKAQRDAIASPQNGLVIFQTDQLPGFYFNAGTTSLPLWKKVGDEVSYPSNIFSNVNYHAPGDYTFTVPDNVYKLFFEIAGGGGGYGGSYTPAVGNLNGGGGGGAGGFASGYFSVTPGELIKIHVGTAGSNG